MIGYAKLKIDISNKQKIFLKLFLVFAVIAIHFWTHSRLIMNILKFKYWPLA